MLRVTQALSVKTSETFLLSNVFQEIPGLVRLTYNPSRESMDWEAYYFHPPVYLPRDLLKKTGRIAKSSSSADLIPPAYIYSDRAFCLDTHRVSRKIRLSESKRWGRKGKETVRGPSAAELPWMNSLKRLTDKSSDGSITTQDLQRDQRAMTKWL